MKHLLIPAIVLVLLAFLGALYVFWCIFIPVKTLVINNFSYTAPIHVETPTLHAGDVLKYKLDYCKYTDAPAVGRRLLVDGQQIPLTNPKISSPLLKGCHIIERDVPIPDTVNPGRYYLDVEIDYYMNPVRIERVYYYTEYFQIVGNSVPSTSEPAVNVESSAIPSPEQARSVILSQ